jgi:hypothetical protein
VLGVDAESVDFARDQCLCRESESGWSEPSKSWRTSAGRSSDHLGGSAWLGAALYDSKAPILLGATRGQTVRWSSRAGRAACRELEPTFLSRAAFCGRHEDDTSVGQGGDDEDDPDMSLQSTATLATSPLHDSSSDGSSSEEMPRSDRSNTTSRDLGSTPSPDQLVTPTTNTPRSGTRQLDTGHRVLLLGGPN